MKNRLSYRLDDINEKIKILEAEIATRAKPFEEDMEIALSFPGVGFISAATIIAETGDYRDFPNADKMAKYFGIVPSV